MSDNQVPDNSAFDRRAFMAGAAGSALVPMTARAARRGRQDRPAVQDPSLPVDVTLRVNGEDKRLRIDARTTVLDALREHLRPHRQQEGLRPRPVRRLHGADRRTAACVSCLTLALAAEGQEITTIEGLADRRSRCIRCSRPSSTTTRSSAAIARPARSCPPSPASRRACRQRRPTSANI